MPKIASALDRESVPAARFHIAFLDGIRGLAALYVVLFHCWLIVNWKEARQPFLPRLLTGWMAYGKLAVAVFIVLSGYCLMLPIAGAAGSRMRYGFGEYIKRRARRILPPYYLCLLVSLALIKLVPGLGQYHGDWWDHVLPAFSGKEIIAHLLLVHNLGMSTAYTINGALWSVATEWQIYFLFPTILLPVWRRWGNGVVVAAAFFIGLLPVFLHHQNTADAARTWFVGLFALGMAGAVISRRSVEKRSGVLGRLAWRRCAIVFAAILVVSLRLPASEANDIIRESLAGFLTVCVILACYQDAVLLSEQPYLLRRVFQHRRLVWLGEFSYSLYLIHALALGVVNLALRGVSLSYGPKLAVLICVGVPLSLGSAYLFHIAFERPFLNTRPSLKQA